MNTIISDNIRTNDIVVTSTGLKGRVVIRQPALMGQNNPYTHFKVRFKEFQHFVVPFDKFGGCCSMDVERKEKCGRVIKNLSASARSDHYQDSLSYMGMMCNRWMPRPEQINLFEAFRKLPITPKKDDVWVHNSCITPKGIDIMLDFSNLEKRFIKLLEASKMDDSYQFKVSHPDVINYVEIAKHVTAETPVAVVHAESLPKVTEEDAETAKKNRKKNSRKITAVIIHNSILAKARSLRIGVPHFTNAIECDTSIAYFVNPSDIGTFTGWARVVKNAPWHEKKDQFKVNVNLVTL